MSSSALAAGLHHLRCKLAAQQHSDESDEHLLRAFTTCRDDNAFAVLVRRHGPMVLGVCRRVLGHEQDAEDAFQATFLVLAQSADSLRNKASLASFLYGTAYRTALKVKRAAACRRKYERSQRALTQPRSPADPTEGISWREAKMLLDEEIARLPEIYRVVFVHFHLQDHSHAETARRLGLKEATVAKRLAAARKRLAQRLARRGVELTGLLAAMALATRTASALPAGLMATTIEAASAMAAGQGLSDVVAVHVAELVWSATASLMLTKAKIAAVVLLLVATSGSLVGLFGRATGPLAATSQPSAETTKAASPQRDATKSVVIHGRVLDAQGKPKPGAKLLLLGEDKIRELGTTAEEGRFTVSVPKTGYLVAQSDNTGMAYLGLLELSPDKPVELRLVKDQMIRGRIVNTEGKPVAGVRVSIRAVIDKVNNELDSFLIERKNGQGDGRFFGHRYLWNAPALLPAATSGADGRFVVHGTGANRLVYLCLRGAGIAEEELWIVNRTGFDPKPYNGEQHNPSVPRHVGTEVREMGVLYGPDLTLIAEAEKEIRGVVKDADSGKGRANVVVYLSSPQNVPIAVPPQTTTDAEGRYVMHGSRKNKSYTVEVVADAQAGYMPNQVEINDTPGYQPLHADIPVKKGVIIAGKVMDRATGKTVVGFVWPDVLHDNPFAKDFPSFNASMLGRGNRVDAAEDGSFRVVTLPGPTLLMGGFTGRSQKEFADSLKYKPAEADAKYPQYFKHLGGAWTYTGYSPGFAPVQGNFCKVLDLKPGTTIVQQDIFLDRASALEIKMEDSEGKPVAGVWATDFAAQRFLGPLWVDGSVCSVYGLETRKPRLVIFWQRTKKLVGVRRLKGDEKSPLMVKLTSPGALKGRLLDAEGKPLSGINVDVVYGESEAYKIHGVIHGPKQVITDAAGAFALEDLIPELKCTLSFNRGKQRMERQAKPDEETIHVTPGECRDLGDIRVKPPR